MQRACLGRAFDRVQDDSRVSRGQKAAAIRVERHRIHGVEVNADRSAAGWTLAKIPEANGEVLPSARHMSAIRADRHGAHGALMASQDKGVNAASSPDIPHPYRSVAPTADGIAPVRTDCHRVHFALMST